MKETEHTFVILLCSLNHEEDKKYKKIKKDWGGFHNWSILKMAALVEWPLNIALV
jgi:hypothetical protein